MVYIGISYSVDFIWDFPIVIGKPIHFGDSWLDPPVLLPSPYHNPRLGLSHIFYTLLTSLNVRISRGLEEFHSLNLAKSALVTRIRKDDWSRAGPDDISNPATGHGTQYAVGQVMPTTPHMGHASEGGEFTTTIPGAPNDGVSPATTGDNWKAAPFGGATVNVGLNRSCISVMHLMPDVSIDANVYEGGAGDDISNPEPGPMVHTQYAVGQVMPTTPHMGHASEGGEFTAT